MGATYILINTVGTVGSHLPLHRHISQTLHRRNTFSGKRWGNLSPGTFPDLQRCWSSCVFVFSWIPQKKYRVVSGSQRIHRIGPATSPLFHTVSIVETKGNQTELEALIMRPHLYKGFDNNTYVEPPNYCGYITRSGTDQCDLIDTHIHTDRTSNT